MVLKGEAIAIRVEAITTSSKKLRTHGLGVFLRNSHPCGDPFSKILRDFTAQERAQPLRQNQDLPSDRTGDPTG